MKRNASGLIVLAAVVAIIGLLFAVPAFAAKPPQPKPRIAVVALNGGDYTDPIDAMNDIDSWCGTPSATNPCLLKINPGVYNIGENHVQMQEYVDIEGSGENVTTIVSTTSSGNYGRVIGAASNSEIRSLTLDAQFGDVYNKYGIENLYTDSFSVKDVTISMSGQLGSLNLGIDNLSASAIKIIDTTIRISGSNGGWCVRTRDYSDAVIENLDCTATGTSTSLGVMTADTSSSIVKNSRVSVGGGSSWSRAVLGVQNPQRPPGDSITLVMHSILEGTIRAATATVNLANSEVNGNFETYLGGLFNCIGIYDGSYSEVICP
jgi:hypothetical protein